MNGIINGCEGEDNAGVGSGGGVVVVIIWVVHMIHVLCLVQVTC